MIEIAGGVVLGGLALIGIIAAWNAIAEARARRFIERHERQQALEMERRGYKWFMGGWIQKGPYDE